MKWGLAEEWKVRSKRQELNEVLLTISNFTGDLENLWDGGNRGNGYPQAVFMVLIIMLQWHYCEKRLIRRNLELTTQSVDTAWINPELTFLSCCDWLSQLNAKCGFCLNCTAPVWHSEFEPPLQRWSVIVFVTLWTWSKLIHSLV